jgi:hypothetical protein
LNRGIVVLQTTALPLGYGTEGQSSSTLGEFPEPILATNARGNFVLLHAPVQPGLRSHAFLRQIQLDEDELADEV